MNPDILSKHIYVLGAQNVHLLGTQTICFDCELSQDMRFSTMWYVQPAKAQTSLRICYMGRLIRTFASRLNIL